jgi:uncharacterized protein (TIGR02246 family)
VRSHSRFSRLAILTSLLLLACAAQQASTSGSGRGVAGVRTQIEQLTAQFVEAFNQGDVATLAAMYDTGAVVLAPNAPPMRGRQNIQAFWAGAKQQGFRTLDLAVGSVEVIGSHAIDMGTYTLVVQPPGQAAVTDRGKYMVLWRRQEDGSWKLYRDMFNTSMPAR